MGYGMYRMYQSTWKQGYTGLILLCTEVQSVGEQGEEETIAQKIRYSDTGQDYYMAQ